MPTFRKPYPFIKIHHSHKKNNITKALKIDLKLEYEILSLAFGILTLIVKHRVSSTNRLRNGSKNSSRLTTQAFIVVILGETVAWWCDSIVNDEVSI